MASNVVPIRTGTGNSGDGSGPEDPMLDKRVAALEGDMKDVKASLSRLELALVKIDGAVSQMPKAMDFAVLKADVAEIKGRLMGVEGRLSSIPTAFTFAMWIIGALITTWSAGAAIVFTLVKFVKP